MMTRIFLMLGLLPILLYGIVLTHLYAVGPLKNALWEELPGIKHVEDDLQYHIPTPIPIILNFRHSVTKDDLLFLQVYADYVSIHLPRWNAASLANYQVRSWDEGWGEKMEMWSSYIPPTLRVDEKFSMETWKQNVKKNRAVYGTFISKNFHYAVLFAGYPADMDELTAIREFRRVIQRSYPPENGSWLENARYYATDYLDTDFTPYQEEGWPEILVGSSAVTRALITWALFVDVDIKSVCGYAAVLFLLFLFFRKPEYALTVWIGTLFAFLATIATIAPLSLLGMRYSVFMLPTLIGGVLITSISFNEQIMEEIKRIEVQTHEDWQRAVQSVRKAINYIFLMALFCFLIFGIAFQSLWIAIVMETVLIVGIVWALVVQKFFLPALYFFFKQRNWHIPVHLSRLCAWFDDAHERLIRRDVAKNCARMAHGKTGIYTRLLFPMCLAALFLTFGRIDTNSRPIAFLGKNYARHMLERMAELGRLDVFPLLLEDKRVAENPLRNEEFYRVAKSFAEELQHVGGIATVTSPTQQIEFEMARDDGLEVPYAKAVSLVQAGAKESSLSQWTEWKNGIVLFASHPMDNTYSMDECLRKISAIKKRFEAVYAWLQISEFGEILHYPEIAKTISAQTPWMLLGTLIAAWLYYARMVQKECAMIPALSGGFVIAQGFLFTNGMVGAAMGLFHIPLDMAIAAIVPVVTNSASDAIVYPAQEFFTLLKQEPQNMSAKEAATQALRKRGKAVNIDCITNIAILSLLILSSFSPVRNLGLLSCLSLAACRWWSVNFTLPQLVWLYEKHNNFSHQMEVIYEKNIPRSLHRLGYAFSGKWL